MMAVRKGFRRKWVITLSGITLLVGLLAWWTMQLITVSGGPIAARLKTQHVGYYAESYRGFVHQTATFSGYWLSDHTGLPEKILRITPTNIPPHTRVRVGLKDHPPTVGRSLKWTAALHVSSRTLQSPTHRATGMIPTVLMQANKSGVYVMNGLLVTYRWDHSIYQAYLPDQFVLCVGSHQRGVCPHHIAPPPRMWPLSWLQAWHLIRSRL